MPFANSIFCASSPRGRRLSFTFTVPSKDRKIDSRPGVGVAVQTQKTVSLQTVLQAKLRLEESEYRLIVLGRGNSNRKDKNCRDLKTISPPIPIFLRCTSSTGPEQKKFSSDHDVAVCHYTVERSRMVAGRNVIYSLVIAFEFPLWSPAG